jgi:hypothetical protein
VGQRPEFSGRLERLARMSYEIRVIEGDVVELSFAAVSAIEEHERARDEVADLCRQKGLTKVLVDMSERSSVMGGATMDLFGFGESFVKGKFPRSASIAVVGKPVAEPDDDLEFVVTVARNRGFAIELFHAVDDALRWLKR